MRRGLTSLLVEPKNGRFPELTERGKELASKMKSSWSSTAFDKPTDFDTWDRCITRGLPPSMFPFNYNNGIEIIQAPGYVVVRLEMVHEARVIPVDGRAQLDPAIKQWMGESRGHFEGNTLVVETTNFNGVGGMTNVGIPGSPRGDTPTTTNMKITERFTRTDDDTIQYEMYVEDPEVLTQPWKARYPMQRDDSYQFFEYACHEDNTAVRNFIVTSRYERAQAAKTKMKTHRTRPGEPAFLAAVGASVLRRRRTRQLREPHQARCRAARQHRRSRRREFARSKGFRSPLRRSVRCAGRRRNRSRNGTVFATRASSATSAFSRTVPPEGPRAAQHRGRCRTRRRLSEDCLYLNVWTGCERRNGTPARDGVFLRRRLHGRVGLRAAL